MDKVKNFFSKHGVAILIIILGGYFGVDVVGGLRDRFVDDNTVEIINNVVSTAIHDSVKAQIDPLAQKVNSQNSMIEDISNKVNALQDSISNKPDIAVITLELDLNKFTTAEEVDTMVDMWIDQGWTAQQGLAKYIVADTNARKSLEGLIIYPEVFRRFILRARRIP